MVSKLRRSKRLSFYYAMILIVGVSFVISCMRKNIEHIYICLLTINGILCAALSLSLVTLLNRQDKLLFRLSSVFLMLVAISFSMLIGVIWGFFEFSMDTGFHKDMQKDTWIAEISSVALDTGAEGNVITISPVNTVLINGGEIV